MPEITVVGSLNLDATVRVARLPAPGETIFGAGRFEDAGGKGANQAVAAARLGRSVAMLGMVGGDDAGKRLVDALTGAGVAVGHVVVHDSEHSGGAIITVDSTGENTIVVDRGANGAFLPDDLAVEPIAAAKVVLLQLEIPLATVDSAIGLARGLVVLNPAPAAGLTPELLGCVDVLVPNATELARLTSRAVPDTPEEAIEAARTLEGPDAIVVTLGALGAVVVDGSGASHVPAPTITAVDPTAAGDAFCGGLADALVRGDTLNDAVGWAVRCGAVAATRWGAQGSLPTRREVLEMGASA